MNPRTVKSWETKITRQMERVAKERDKLDRMIADMTDLRDCCDRAHELLFDARDALSEIV